MKANFRKESINFMCFHVVKNTLRISGGSCDVCGIDPCKGRAKYFELAYICKRNLLTLAGYKFEASPGRTRIFCAMKIENTLESTLIMNISFDHLRSLILLQWHESITYNMCQEHRLVVHIQGSCDISLFLSLSLSLYIYIYV